jgi:glycosyltransferase 2 family protein
VADDEGAEERDGEIFGLDKRKALITIVAAAVLVAGAIALIGSVANFGKLLHALRRGNKLWFPLCAGGEALAYFGYILAYRDLARVDGGPVLPYRTVTRVVAAGFGAHVVGSSAGTLAVDFWALHRAGAKVHDAARRVLALNTLEWAALGSIAALSSIAVLAGRGQGAPLPMTLAWLIVVPLCITAALWVTASGRAERLATAPDTSGRPSVHEPGAWPRWLWGKLRKGIADGIGGVVLLRYLLAHPLRYRDGVIGYPLYWAGDIVCLYAALRAFGVRIDAAPLILAYTTGYVITALPLPAGGAGGVEATLSTTLHLVGVPFAPALLASFVYRIFSFWLPILPALYFLPRLKQLAEQLPQAQPEQPPAEHADAPAGRT